ncbi:MAG TPA: hypothetical protein VF487_10055 [Chitinophagaceae bacterium]
MKHSPKYEPMILAHWTYTRDEWKAFTRWRKSLFHYLLHRIPFYSKPIPEVRITSDSVWIGERQQHFSSDEHQLKRINFQEQANMNIMVITYEWFHKKSPGYDEIWIPVPKGKLREAIAVQEQLTRID